MQDGWVQFLRCCAGVLWAPAGRSIRSGCMLPHVHLPEQASPMQAKMSHLLEKALGVATQHNLVAFKQWVERELDGYPPSVAIPEYRCVPVEITSPALADVSCFKTPEQFAQCYVPHSMPDIEK